MKPFILVYTVSLLTACQNNSLKETKTDTVNTATDSSVELSAAGSYSTNNCVALFNKAKQMDSTIMAKMDMDVALANKAIKLFTDYAFYCESDSLSPVFLIKTAQIAASINNPNQAKVVLDRCINNYPKFKNKPAAIFLLAQLYDEPTQLNNEEEAKRLYEKLIYDYPKTEWAVNAKAALILIGKTDQEIINEFNKKTKKGG
jgi:outer membrane protein assembly factor BamD (BamD/ComL family)